MTGAVCNVMEVSLVFTSLPRLKNPSSWAKTLVDAVRMRFGECEHEEPMPSEDGIWTMVVRKDIDIWGGEDEAPSRIGHVMNLFESASPGMLLGPLSCLVGDMEVRAKVRRGTT
jgi:hypothetical protein